MFRLSEEYLKAILPQNEDEDFVNHCDADDVLSLITEVLELRAEVAILKSKIPDKPQGHRFN